MTINLDFRKIELEGELVLIAVADEVVAVSQFPESWSDPVRISPNYAFADWRAVDCYVQEVLEEARRTNQTRVLYWPLDTNGQYKWTSSVCPSASIAVRCLSDCSVVVDKVRDRGTEDLRGLLLGEAS